jgi:preprotein translocase subunit YajC
VFHDELLKSGFIGKVLKVGDDEVTIGEGSVHGAKFLL